MLIPQLDGRPSIIQHNGWTIYLSVIDASYLYNKKQWEQRRNAAHPDKGGQHDDFIRIQQQYTRWRDGEALRYAEWGIALPDGYQGSTGALREHLAEQLAPKPKQRQLSGRWANERRAARPPRSV